MKLNTSVSFTESDFLQYMQLLSNNETNINNKYDIIFIGLSLHHLRLDDKLKFFESAIKSLNTNGSLIIYEPIFQLNKTRDDYYKHVKHVMSTTCTTLIEGDLEIIFEHMLTYDFPEEIQTYYTLADKVGFTSKDLLYSANEGFYALLRFQK